MASFRFGLVVVLPLSLTLTLEADAQRRADSRAQAPPEFRLVSGLRVFGSLEPNTPLAERFAPGLRKKDGPRELRLDLRGGPERRYQLSLYTDETSDGRRTRLRYALPGSASARPTLFMAAGFDGINVRHAEPARGSRTRGLDVLRRHDDRLFRWQSGSAGLAGFSFELSGRSADALASTSAAAVLGRILQLIAR